MTETSIPGFCPWGEEGFTPMNRPRKYPPELLDRGARVVIESGRPIAHVARDLGVPSETLRKYVRQIEADEGLRPDLPNHEPAPGPGPRARGYRRSGPPTASLRDDSHAATLQFPAGTLSRYGEVTESPVLR